MTPGAGIGEHIHAQCEEMFFGIDNTMHYIHNGRKIEVPGPAFVVCHAGESHGIFNPTETDTRWFNFNCCLPGQTYDATDLHPSDDAESERASRESMELEPNSDRIPVGRFDRALLRPLAQAPHGGKGRVLYREVYGQQDFRSMFA